MFRYFKTVLIFTLVLVTALLVPTQAIAAANNGKYVSEHLDEPIELDIQ